MLLLCSCHNFARQFYWNYWKEIKIWRIRWSHISRRSYHV